MSKEYMPKVKEYRKREGFVDAAFLAERGVNWEPVEVRQ